MRNPRDKKAFVESLEAWYKVNARQFPWRKLGTSRYRLIATELLLQQTQAQRVSDLYHHFFTRFPSWKSLSAADVNDIRDEIRTLGLWRRRSDVIKRLAIVMASRNGRFPSARGQIEQLPGVGQYIANSIELFAHGREVPLLDVNMARVVDRVFAVKEMSDIRYDRNLQVLAHELVSLAADATRYNWAAIDFGAKVCVQRNPKCVSCPLKLSCTWAAREGRLFRGGC